MRRLFLVGFAASGKSTVGKNVASTIGCEFSDLDDLIEKDLRMTCAAVFSTKGEAFFREAEARLLDQFLSNGRGVLATGGGTACSTGAMEKMRKHGLVVALHADLEVCKKRASANGARPLMSMPAEELRELYEARQWLYRKAHATVRSDSQESTEKIVVGLLELSKKMASDSLDNTVFVVTSEKICPVIFVHDELGKIGSWCRLFDLRFSKTAIVTDQNVGVLYAKSVNETVSESLDAGEVVTVAAGEKSKSFPVFESVQKSLIEKGLDRSSAVLALGGGVVGDLAGFAASTLFRGVSYLQAPTTVLAMVDSSVGGKTGINLAGGKNLIGAFWQPDLVLADTKTLETLPLQERQAAFGEVLKYGLLDGEECLAEVEAVAAEFAGTEPVSDRLRKLFNRCVRYKAWAVALDEREKTGIRAFLNLGHTVGHAIEAHAGLGTISHGHAVGLGLLAACRLSFRLKISAVDLEPRVASALRSAGIEPELDPWLIPEVLEWVSVDKKRTADKIRFIAISQVGHPVARELSLDELKAALAPLRE